MRLARALTASLSLVTGAGCGGGDLFLPADQAPADLVAVNGDGQVGEVGTELADPLVIRVLDAQDRPMPGIRVAFVLGIGANGGDTDPDTATTNGDGLASARWRLGGTTGRQEVNATIVGGGLSVEFSAAAERTSTLRLERTSGDEQVATPGEELPEPLVVRLVDGSGTGVPGRAVTWVVATGGGSPDHQSSETDADGFASARWTLGPVPGPNTINAVVSGVGVVSFTATAVADGQPGPSPERSSVAASPVDIVVGTGVSIITVTVRDASGAAVSGATITLAATGSGNVVSQPAAPTGSDGVATGTLQSVLPGTKVVSAVVNGTIAVAETAEVTVTAIAEPNRLEFRVPPSDTDEDETISPAVEVAIRDAGGEEVPLTGVAIEIELLDDRGRVSKELEGGRVRSTESGVARFPDLSVDREGRGYRLRAFAPGRPELEPVVSSPFDVED